jgi:nucleoside-diphosphate-sugar epimerase
VPRADLRKDEIALTADKAVVLGATGPTGYHLVQALTAASIPIRVVSRSKQRLSKTFGDSPVEPWAADLLLADETIQALAECDVVFDCVGLPARQMHLHGTVARNIAGAMRITSSRCVQVSSYWSYLPVNQTPLNETHPRQEGSAWMRHRREAEDILQQAGTAVLHLPDFYGPHVHTSTLQQALTEAAAGKTMNWIGRKDVAREYVFVPDAMKIAMRVAGKPEAYGERWIVQGSGAIMADEVAQIAASHLDHPVKVRSAGPILLTLVSFFNADLRGFMQMVPEYTKPISFDASRLEQLIGRPNLTPYASAIPQTLDWLERLGS